jgi:hypothetical protein
MTPSLSACLKFPHTQKAKTEQIGGLPACPVYKTSVKFTLKKPVPFASACAFTKKITLR